MKQSLLEWLCSPRDGSKLDLAVSRESTGEIIEGTLSDASGSRFPIREGIPYFAEEKSEDETFSFKWNLIGDSYGHDQATRETRQNWYLERFGFGTRERLREFLGARKLVLDAGTGSGVDAAMFAESGSTVVAVDLCREAVRATYRRLGGLPNVQVAQADLAGLPFGRVFDFISCDQVLHHTPDPPTTFASLARRLKPGGRLALYVYKRKGPIREFTDDYIRSRTTRMPARECYEFCAGLTRLGQALSELNATVEIPEDISLLGIKAGSQDLQLFVYWNMIKCFWNRDYDFVTNNLINFDWYHPRYASRHTPEEVRAWFEGSGLEVERENIIPSGIAVLGRLTGEKP